MAYMEPAEMPLRQVKMERAEDSGEDFEAVCGGNENEDDEDVAVPDPASMLSVRLEEEEPSNLKMSIEPALPPAVLDKDCRKNDKEHPLSQIPVKAVDLLPTTVETQTQKPALYLCEKCPNAFKIEAEFHAHVESHKVRKAHPCDKCEKSFNRKSELNVHSRTHCEVKPFACHLCEKTFAQKNNLLRHLRTHSGEKPFQCDQCSRTFAQKELLTAHIRIHTGERPYSCLVCGQAFNQRHTLTRHVREHANRDTAKAYSCSQCGKTFPRQVNLDIHMRTHTGERPFECEMCTKRFSQSGHLARHMLTHTGKTPFPCPVCGKGFSQKKRLVDHARTHTGERPFGCHYCPKSFTHAEYLKSHLHTHREEKYVCPICRLMFSRKYKLMEHMNTHSGEYPFKCAHCNAYFISKDDMANHIHSRHLSEMMGDGASAAEKSHVSPISNTATGFDEPELPPYRKIENRDTGGKLTGTVAAGFASPSDEKELNEPGVQPSNSVVVQEQYGPPEHSGAVSERVCVFIKEEHISDVKSLAQPTRDRESNLSPQIFPGTAPKIEPIVIIKEEIDVVTEEPLCLRSDTQANTSEAFLATRVTDEIKLSATTIEDSAAKLGKYPYLEGMISERTSKEKQVAEEASDDEYFKFHKNEGMQKYSLSGSDSLDENLFSSVERPLCLKSETVSKVSLEKLVSAGSGKVMASVNVNKEPNLSEEQPSCFRNGGVCKTLPPPNLSIKTYPVANLSESTGTEMQCPLYLGKGTLPPPSISGSDTSAKLGPSVTEQSISNVESPLCLKSGTVTERLVPNICPDFSSGTKWSTTIQNPLSNSEAPLSLKRNNGSKCSAPSSVANIDSGVGPRTDAEERLVPSSRHPTCFTNSSMCRTVPAHLASNFSQKMRQRDTKEHRLTTVDHPLCLKRDAGSDNLPPSHLSTIASKTKTKINIRKDLVASLESPLCLKTDIRCQSLQGPFVSNIRKMTEGFPLPSGTTLTVSAQGNKEIYNVNTALVSYRQMLYDKLVSDLHQYSGNN